MEQSAGGNWVEIAALAVSIVSLLLTLGIAVVGWLAKGLFSAIREEIAELRKDRERARQEHREDQEAFRRALSELSAKTDSSMRRVHERVDGLAQTTVQQSQCFVKHDEVSTSFQRISEQLTSLGEGLHSEISDILKCLAMGAPK